MDNKGNTINSNRNNSSPSINTSVSQISKINSEKSLNNSNQKDSNINKSSMNFSFQINNQNSKEIKNMNRSGNNSQSKILEENFLDPLSEEHSNEDSNNDSQVNSESNSQRSDSPIDFDIENLNKSLRDILENISENEVDYIAGLEKYYEHLKEKLKILEESEIEKIHQRQILDIESDSLDEQINYFHSMNEEFKAENKKLKSLVKSEKLKSPHLQFQIDENSLIVERIYSAIKYIDVTKLIKFQKVLINKRGIDMELEEATNSARGPGGDYLKRQAALIYFIHLLKLRYALTKIAQDSSKTASKDIITPVTLNINEIKSEGKTYDNKIRIIFGGESYLVGLDEDEEETYTILELKNEVCDVWNIPKEDREYYHIINDKFHVYSNKILVWDIHLNFIETVLDAAKKDSSKSCLMSLELINKNQIVYGRNAGGVSASENAVNKLDKNKRDTNVVNSNDLERIKKDADISSMNGNFTSILEEYVLYLRQKEAFFNLFKRDRIKEDIIKKNQEKMKLIEQKHDQQKKELEKQEADDEEFQEIENRKEAELKEMKEKIKYKLLNHNNKQDPLYFSTYDLYLFRLVKFWHLVFYIFIVALTMSYFTSDSTIKTIEKYTLGQKINDVILFNPLYKDFLRNHADFSKKIFRGLIKTRKSLLIWLDVIFNNLIMNSNVSLDEINDVDAYNNYFQRNNTIYEILGAIKFSFKNSYPVSSKANETIFILPTNISDTLYYFEEFKVTEEDTALKPISSDSAENLQNSLGQFENQICDGCLTNRNLSYDSYPNRKMPYVNGEFGDYSDGNFQYYVNPNHINREEFYGLIDFVKQTSITYPECRMLKIDININHIYLRSIIKISVIFEFSTIGDINPTVFSDVYDTNLSGSSFSTYIRYVFYAIFVIIGFKIFMNYFTFFLLRNQAKKINYWPIYCEIAIIALLIIEISFSFKKASLYQDILGTLFDFNTSTLSTYNAGINKWYFYEIDPLLKITRIQKSIRGGILLLLFLRITLCFLSSPIIKYIMVISIRTTVGIFNVIVILFIFIFSFSLIFHVILGKYVVVYSSLSNTFLNTLTSVLGRLQIVNTENMTTVHYFIVVSFFIVIKFIIFPFLYAIIKETFENVREEYNDYITKPHFIYVGETIHLFLKYLMFPVSFYFMFRDYMRFRTRYKDFPKLEKFVKEDNNRKFPF